MKTLVSNPTLVSSTSALRWSVVIQPANHILRLHHCFYLSELIYTAIWHFRDNYLFQVPEAHEASGGKTELDLGAKMHRRLVLVFNWSTDFTQHYNELVVYRGNDSSDNIL